MNVENITINTQSSIRLSLDKIIYFDPFEIKDDRHDADIIFITHSHYDHMDSASINKVKKNNTLIVAPKSIEEEIRKMGLDNMLLLIPNEEVTIDGIKVKAIPAYNIEKTFHPRKNNWLGYLVEYKDISYYVAGDTDKIEEALMVRCDIALIPIGGKYTMDIVEASELVRIIKPKIVIPTHYGSIVGDILDGEKFKNSLADTDIKVILKL